MKMNGTQAVALTFDDGPSPEWTPKILGLLRQYGVKATFCLIGVNVQAHPELVQAIVRDGHTLCNHTWRHDLTLGNRSPAEIRADLQRTNDAIHAAVPGARIAYFRHPGGNFTNNAVAIARDMGMASIHWDVDPQDWRKPPAPAIVNVVVSHTKPGSIVLLHDGGGERPNTYTACQTILPNLQGRFTLIALP